MKRNIIIIIILILCVWSVNSCGLSEETSTQNVTIGNVIFTIPAELKMEDKSENSVMFKARQDQIVGWILQFSLFNVPSNITEDADPEKNVGHAYQLMDGLINKQEGNSSGIQFDEYKKEMTMINDFPCIVLKATTGNMKWYEFVTYKVRKFSRMAFVAHIDDKEAEDVFDAIVESIR